MPASASRPPSADWSASARPWVVMKFGGTSVAAPERWRVIADIARERLDAGERVLIVHSALAGVSNLLEALPAAALAGAGEGAAEAVKDAHRAFAAKAGLDADALLAGPFDLITRRAAGIAYSGEASARLRAELMAQGELMASVLGLECLRGAGLEAETLDAREALVALNTADEARAWLDNSAGEDADPALQARLANAQLVLTQGFIARHRDGGTVLLGRGGSDTSAAYFAARIGAARLEIWTDVPGLFSADPRLTEGARHLRALSYEEAQEIATMGGKVLHPRCIGPARRANIPLEVRSTLRPELAGTTISASPGDDAPRLKAVSVKTGVRLVAMEGSGMWRQAGFLADVFAGFKACGVSVDLVSTSETNVTVSLDPDPGLDAARLERLRETLAPLCRVRIIENAAAVSLLGYGIRRILHQLAPALEMFQDKPIRLVSQAANDLNFTVVVDEAEGAALAKRLHEELISPAPEGPVFGPSWAELARPADARPARSAPWWRTKRAALLDAAPDTGGLYVYDLETVSARARAVAGIQSLSRAFYAMKANAHRDVLRAIRAAGLGFECVSPGEIARLQETFSDLTPDEVLFTPNFAHRSEYEAARAFGAHLTIDGLHPLTHWAETLRGAEVILRVNPDRPRGHHQHVKTAGPKAKFGIPLEALDEARAAAEAAGVRVIGLHAHAGSGVTEADHWREIGAILANAARHFPDARILNCGGGLGVPESPDAPALDLAEVDAQLALLKKAHPRFELWMEPGRYPVAEAGVLLARVTQVKHAFGARFIGLGTGMNSLIRPALYGARHEIVNLTRLDEPGAGLASVVGPICESADLLGAERLLPETREGDVMLIAEAGAYGAVMASRYNLREPAGERVI
ncbi:bifunctional aspartate kinase/diaminopimelate decarboxylase [Alkalicaulis satelles]|uniref:aspartate kinase n=1 Tax=Alkalicaulis satelles TaxID=2609175 RepID=A0A5M6ZP40_9PROT|nr:bifunctional aspartate kinase/diaminopimelate decarboxylase [Alkalicaulis satelles]KAA5803981.1 bifunctional aspartate kinase/diaminopimelate decarboxylase [Alkalicaulis satelles]